MEHSTINTKLTEYINCDKFTTYTHLQPAVENSTPETRNIINNLFNNSARKLQNLILNKNFTEKTVKDILLQTVSNVEREQLDTEDFEFGYELIGVLSEITGISIEAELNKQQEEAFSPEILLEMIKKKGFDPKDFGL